MFKLFSEIVKTVLKQNKSEPLNIKQYLGL